MTKLLFCHGLQDENSGEICLGLIREDLRPLTPLQSMLKDHEQGCCLELRPYALGQTFSA